MRPNSFTKKACDELERRARGISQKTVYTLTHRSLTDGLLATIRSLRRELALVRKGYWMDAACPKDTKGVLMDKADEIRDRRERPCRK